MTAAIRTLRSATLLSLAFVASCAHYVPRPLSPRRSIVAFDARSLNSRGLRAFLIANGVRPPGPSDVWNLKSLTLAAFYFQPSLAEARARLLAAQAARATAAERPNPSVTLAPGYDRGVPGAVSPWIVPLTMDWPVETAGRRADRLARARHLAAAKRWELVGTVWQTRRHLRTALLDLYSARTTAALLARKLSAQRMVVKLLTGQFAAGTVSSFVVTQARIALDGTRLDRQAAAAQVQQAQIQLAGALGLAPHALRRVRLDFSDLKILPRDLTRPQVRQAALLDRSDVRAALEQYAASQSALKLQIARQWPDIHLGPGFIWNSQLVRDTQWQLGLSLPLPIMNRNQGPIAEARADRRLAAAHFLAVQARALGQIDSAVAGYHSALHAATTADSLLKNLRRQLQSVRAQLDAGEIQPLDLENAKVAFDTGAQNRLAAWIEAQQALGRLEDAVQSPIALALASVRAAQDGPADPENP